MVTTIRPAKEIDLINNKYALLRDIWPVIYQDGLKLVCDTRVNDARELLSKRSKHKTDPTQCSRYSIKCLGSTKPISYLSTSISFMDE